MPDYRSDQLASRTPVGITKINNLIQEELINFNNLTTTAIEDLKWVVSDEELAEQGLKFTTPVYKIDDFSKIYRICCEVPIKEVVLDFYKLYEDGNRPVDEEDLYYTKDSFVVLPINNQNWLDFKIVEVNIPIDNEEGEPLFVNCIQIWYRRPDKDWTLLDAFKCPVFFGIIKNYKFFMQTREAVFIKEVDEKFIRKDIDYPYLRGIQTTRWNSWQTAYLISDFNFIYRLHVEHEISMLVFNFYFGEDTDAQCTFINIQPSEWEFNIMLSTSEETSEEIPIQIVYKMAYRSNNAAWEYIDIGSYDNANCTLEIVAKKKEDYNETIVSHEESVYTLNIEKLPQKVLHAENAGLALRALEADKAKEAEKVEEAGLAEQIRPYKIESPSTTLDFAKDYSNYFPYYSVPTGWWTPGNGFILIELCCPRYVSNQVFYETSLITINPKEISMQDKDVKSNDTQGYFYWVPQKYIGSVKPDILPTTWIDNDSKEHNAWMYYHCRIYGNTYEFCFYLDEDTGKEIIKNGDALPYINALYIIKTSMAYYT